ncbi:MAG: transcriptional regulator [Geminicoccaceae bacterium]
MFKALQGWQKNDPGHIRACLTEKMTDAGSKLARFVGIDAYTAAGGTSRGDLFGKDIYLEKPALLHKLADAKMAGMHKALEAEGWGWVEINPERDWQVINRCDRLRPQLIDAPAEMLAERERIKAELAEIERALEDTESDAPIDAQGAAEGQLADIEEQLTAHVGFDAGQKKLAGCFVSIGQDGTPFIDKGLVKPEHKKQLAKLLKAEAGDDAPEQAKPKGGLSQALLRDLAAYRQQAAQAELAKHPAIAFDLLAFHVADSLLGMHTAHDGPDVQFRQQFPKASVELNDRPATIIKGLSTDWRKPKTEAARFEAFRALADAEKLGLLARCVALTLQPKLAPAAGDEATAYDIALALTGADVAGYWRPTRANYLARITREQLLAAARDTLGEAWAQSRFGEKKAALVDQLDRAFGDPEGQGRTPEQAEKLKRWLPEGMAFGLTAAKPARAKKARKAA